MDKQPDPSQPAVAPLPDLPQGKDMARKNITPFGVVLHFWTCLSDELCVQWKSKAQGSEQQAGHFSRPASRQSEPAPALALLTLRLETIASIACQYKKLH